MACIIEVMKQFYLIMIISNSHSFLSWYPSNAKIFLASFWQTELDLIEDCSAFLVGETVQVANLIWSEIADCESPGLGNGTRKFEL